VLEKGSPILTEADPGAVGYFLTYDKRECFSLDLHVNKTCPKAISSLIA
jgi:hypothetical protein